MNTRNLTKKRTTARKGVTTLASAGTVTVTKSPSTPFFLGSGEHTYEAIHDWLTPPTHLKFGDTQGLAQDAQGNVYVAHTVHPDSVVKDAIAIFNDQGCFIGSWGERFCGGAHGLEIRREGRDEFLYHCDTAHRQVVKTTLQGAVIWEKGLPTEAGVYTGGDPFIPTNLTFSPNGDFYITDGYGSDWIHQFDLKGNHLRTFGGKGTEPGKVSNAHGIGVDLRGEEPFLVIADRGNNRLQYFTLDGEHVRFMSDGMRLPCHVRFHGDLMLIPDLKSVVTLLDRDNKVVAQLGDGDPSDLRGASRSQFLPGKFIHPHDAIFLRNGDILVAEWVPTGRVTLLRKRG